MVHLLHADSRDPGEPALSGHPRLTICSRPEASRRLCARDGVSPTHVVSIGASWEAPPDGFDAHPAVKLRLTFDDTHRDKGTRRAPAAADLAAAIALARALTDTQANVLVHCGAGVSRAPAVAYVMLCVWLGPGEEAQAAAILGQIRPGAVPNRRVLELGDELLERQGALLRAFGHDGDEGPEGD